MSRVSAVELDEYHMLRQDICTEQGSSAPDDSSVMLSHHYVEGGKIVLFPKLIEK